MKFKKRFLMVFCSVALLAGMLGGGSVAAADDIPTPVSPDYIGPSGEYPPLGAGSEFEGGGDWPWYTWEAYITNTWTGYHWMGWIVSAEYPGPVILSLMLGKSNGYSASIGVQSSILSGTVGYDVTYSTALQASYQHDITPGMVGFIGYSNFYDNTVHDLDVFLIGRDYEWPYEWIEQQGTACTWSWTRWHFDYGETTSAGQTPPTPVY